MLVVNVDSKHVKWTKFKTKLLQKHLKHSNQKILRTVRLPWD